MQIEQNGGTALTIIGNIKSIEDGAEIKNAVNALIKNGVKSVTLTIRDSFSMTSTVIGHLMKVVNLDKVAVSLVVGDARLYQLLEDLSLVQAFKARLAGK